MIYVYDRSGKKEIFNTFSSHSWDYKKAKSLDTLKSQKT